MGEKDFAAMGKVAHELAKAKQTLACLQRRLKTLCEDTGTVREEVMLRRRQVPRAVEGDSFILEKYNGEPWTLEWPTANQIEELLTRITGSEQDVANLEDEARRMGI